MLRRSTPAVGYCQKRASECELLAEIERDPDRKQFYARLAEQWRKLADQREFTDRMGSFLNHLKNDG